MFDQIFRILLFVPVFLASLLAPLPARAQITETTRIELTDEQSSIPIAQHIYFTEDREKRLTSKVILSRHQNNLRGTRIDRELVNLGPKPSPIWMLFSVTNSSSRENWILDFGDVFSGRFGHIRSLMVENETTGQIFIKAGLSEDNASYNVEAMRGSALPIRIPKDQTQIFLMYLEMDSSLSNTFKPSLIRYDVYMDSLVKGKILAQIFSVFLLALIGFFSSLALTEKTYEYLYFSAFYALELTLFHMVEQAFLIQTPYFSSFINMFYLAPVVIGLLSVSAFFKLSTHEETASTLSYITITLISACMVFSLFLTRNQSSTDEFLIYASGLIGLGVCTIISFTQSQQGRHGGIFMAGAWFCGFIGLLALFLIALGVIDANSFTMNLYWLALLPQSFLFVMAAKKKTDLVREDQLSMLARESRTAQSLVRLKQSKETADQARLLRVIERERELMAELREREMQRTEEMRRAKEMADEANRAKSAFLAVVSHEIRTPMNGLMGMIRLLMDSKMTRQQNEYLQAMQKSGDTMMALLNDILDFEKIESGNMDIENIDFDMIKLVQGVVTLMSGHVAEKGIKLRAEISENFPASLKGDPTRLRQVLLNLVSNAIKFTSTGGVTIHLKSTPSDKSRTHVKADYEIYCAVEDTGIGISEEAQKKLFSPFVQAETNTARKYGGTGLGLAICRRLIEAMGSSIQVNSEAGIGSTFFFTLWLEKGEIIEDSGGYETPEEEINQGPSLHILVIDDNELNRKVLKGFLEKDGHHCVLCESAEDALEQLKAGVFDAVITDVRLGGMDGIEFTQTVRDLPDSSSARIPIIALSGNVSAEDQALYREAGMNGFVPKPLDPVTLRTVLREATHNRTPSENLSPPIENKAPAEPSRPHEEKLEADSEFDSFALAQEADENGHHGALDASFLQGLADALPRPQLQELIQSCLDKNDELIVALNEGLLKTDASWLRERAHELKGMSANFGFTELSALGGSIEKLTKAGDIEGARPDILKLTEAQLRAKAEAQEWLNNLSD